MAKMVYVSDNTAAEQPHYPKLASVSNTGKRQFHRCNTTTSNFTFK